MAGSNVVEVATTRVQVDGREYTVYFGENDRLEWSITRVCNEYGDEIAPRSETYAKVVSTNAVVRVLE